MSSESSNWLAKKNQDEALAVEAVNIIQILTTTAISLLNTNTNGMVVNGSTIS